MFISKNVLYRYTIIYFVIFLSFISCIDNTQKSSENIEALLSKMTLEEKIGQLNQYNGFWDVTGPVPENGQASVKYENLRKGYVGSMLNVIGVEDIRTVQRIAVEESRLGIPLIIGLDVVHGYKTISPIPLAEAASWDLPAIEKSARMAAMEASAAGINWTFAPMVDISRDARWGRVMEGAGEDPFLGSKIAEARVRGFQGDNLAAENTIAACAKHFAAYGFSESGKDYNTVDIGTSTLYNIVLPPFEAAKDAGVRTFMNSFNELNGIPATGSRFLQRDLLKEKWNFDGFIVSDWGSISEMKNHGYAQNDLHAVELAIKAGSDMDMESHLYIKELANLVNNNKVDIELIDDAVRRILRVKYELGLFDDPYKYCDAEREKAVIGNPEIVSAALDMAKKSIVLLKNEGTILPLKKEGQNIALIGALADDKTSPLGSWRAVSEDNSAVSVKEGMERFKNNNLVYAQGASLIIGEVDFKYELQVNTTDTSGFKEAIDIARKSDVVVMVLGEHGFQSGEGRSRTSLGLPGVQQELLEEVFKVNSNIVLVLTNGRPLTIDWADENIPAIIEAWHLGTQSGNAIADVLYGDYNPSGKLPMTFPRSVGQVPLYYNYKNTGRPSLPGPNLVFWSHYIDEENTPLYPFGYGLSYTSFEYSDLRVSNDMTANETITVKVNLKNVGEVEGAEVVQLYLNDSHASVTRPVKELKGFKKLSLQPSESQEVTFELTRDELGFYDNYGNWVVEPGEFIVYVGGSSTTSLASKFELK